MTSTTDFPLRLLAKCTRQMVHISEYILAQARLVMIFKNSAAPLVTTEVGVLKCRLWSRVHRQLWIVNPARIGMGLFCIVLANVSKWNLMMKRKVSTIKWFLCSCQWHDQYKSPLVSYLKSYNGIIIGNFSTRHGTICNGVYSAVRLERWLVYF